MPWPWNGPALYVTEHCTGKRRKERIVKGIGTSQAGVFYSRRGVKEGASARKVANYGIASGESREG